MLQKSTALELREHFLSAMRTVANSVTVVTTSGEGGTHGATVSSFCSVSADPPTLLVCLNKEGSTGSAIETNGTFCINILPSGWVETAKTFADPGSDKLAEFDKDLWTHGANGLPILLNASAFVCRTAEVIEATSHLVIIGELLEVQIGDKEPLIYLNQRFRGISSD